jgi:hypothetical protein
MSEEKHSLKTEIELFFGDAVSETERLANAMALLNTAVTASEGKLNLSQLVSDFNKLKEALSGEGRLVAELDAGNIKKRVESFLNSAINNMQIELKQETRGRKSKQIDISQETQKLTEQAQKQMMGEVKKAIEEGIVPGSFKVKGASGRVNVDLLKLNDIDEMIKLTAKAGYEGAVDVLNSIKKKITQSPAEQEGFKFVIPPSAVTAIKGTIQEKIIAAMENAQVHGNFKPVASFNLKSLDLIQKRMKTALEEAINKNLEFEFIHGKTKEKVPFKFTLTTELMHRVIEMAQRELAKVLVNPESVQLPKDAKQADFKVNVIGMEETLNKIKTWVTNVNNHFLSADADVNKLIASNIDMENFQQKITSIGDKIKQVSDAFKKIQVSDESSNLAALVKEAESLQTSVINFLTVYKAIPKTIRESLDHNLSVVLKEYESSLTQLKVDAAKEELIKGFGQVEKKMKTAIEQSFVQLIEQTPHVIDASKLLTIYNAWSKSMTEHLDRSAREELSTLSTSIISNSQAVMHQFTQSLLGLLHVVVPPSAEKKDEVTVPYMQVQERIRQRVQDFVQQLVGDFTISRPPQEGEGIGINIEIPQVAMNRVQTILKDMVEEQLRELTGRIGTEKPSLSKEETKAIDEMLYAESKKILNLVVDQARSIAKSFTDGISKDGFATFTQEERAKVREQLLQGMGHIVAELSSSMQVLLQTFSIPRDLGIGGSEKVRGLLNNIFKGIDNSVFSHLNKLLSEVEVGGRISLSTLPRMKKELRDFENKKISRSEIEEWKKHDLDYQFLKMIKQSRIMKPSEGDAYYSDFYVTRDHVTGARQVPELPKWIQSLFVSNKDELGKSISHAAANLDPKFGIKSETEFMDYLKRLASKYDGMKSIEERLKNELLNDVDRAVIEHMKSTIRQLEQLQKVAKAALTPRLRKTGSYRIKDEHFEQFANVIGKVSREGVPRFSQKEIDQAVAQRREKNASVIGLRQKLNETTDAVVKEVENKLLHNIDSGFVRLIEGIRGINVPPIEFTIVGRIQSWMQQVQDETARVLERMVDSSLRPVLEQNIPFPTHNAGHGQPFIHAGSPYPPGFNPFGSPAQTGNEQLTPYIPQAAPRTDFDRMHALERQALINAERIQNRFNNLMQKGNFTPDNFRELTDILNAYQAEVGAAASRYRNVLTQLGTDGTTGTEDETVARLLAEARTRLREETNLAKQRLDHYIESTFKPASQSDALTKRLLQQELKNAGYLDAADLNVQKMQTRFYGKLDEAQMQALNGELSRYYQLAQQVSSMHLLNEEDIAASKREMQYLNQLLASISARYSQIAKQTAEANKQQRDRDKRGELIGQHDLLRNMSISSAKFKDTLKQMNEFSNFVEITNAQVRKGADGWNSWSATLKTAEGNTVRMSGVINMLTGEIYRQSESIREAQSRLERYAQMSAIASPFANSMRGGRGWQKDYSLPNHDYTVDQSVGISPGGDTRTFMGSVVNTMRYMTAGMLMGTPTMMFHSAFESAKEFDYQLEKARQNFIIKDAQMWNQAVQEVSMQYGNIQDSSKLNELVKKESDRLVYEIRDGAVKRLQDISITYAVQPEEVSKSWQIASRLMDSPDEAIAFTREVAKVRTLEEVDVEKAAMGFEAIKAQWGISGYQMEKFNNMMIKAANISSAKIEDLLQANQRSGSIMRNNLEGSGMKKEDAFAATTALYSLFVQGTGRSGAEAGTFFKNVTERPYQWAQATYFKKKAKELGIAELDPYTTDAQGNQQKRAYTDWLAAFIKAMAVAMPQDKTEMLKQSSGIWHSGSTSAIESMITDLQHQSERIAKIVNNNRQLVGLEKLDEKAQLDQIIKEYVKQILETKPEDIDVMLAGMSSTWKFQTERVKAMWSVATFGVFDALKPEFQSVVATLGIVLRSMQENAETWAQAIQGITNIGMMLAAGYGVGWVGEKWKESGKQTQRDEIDRHRGLLQAERGAISLRKDLLEDRLAQFHSQHGKEIERFNAVKDEKVYKSRTELIQAEGQLQQEKNRYDRIKNRLTPFEDEQERARIYSLERNVDEKRRKAEEHERKHGLDSRVLDEYSRLQEEMAQVAVQATRLNQRMDLLDRAAREMGVDVSKLEVEMTKLDTEFRNGSLNMDRYNNLLRETAREAGIADDNVMRLQREIDKLNREFAQGQINAQKYIATVAQLRNQHLTGDAALPGGGYGGVANQQGAGLLNMIAQGSLFAALMGGFGGRSIFKRTGDVWARMKEAVQDRSVGGFVRSFGSFFGRGLERDENGKIVRDENGRVRHAPRVVPVEGAAGEGRGMMSRLAASSPRLASVLSMGGSFLKTTALGAIAWTGIEALFGAMTYGMANKNEKTQINIQEFKDIENNVKNIKESSSVLMKILLGVNEGFDALADGLKTLITDFSFEGFAKHWNAWVIGWNAKTPEEFEKQMEAQAGVRLRENMIKLYGAEEVAKMEAEYRKQKLIAPNEALTLEDYKAINQQRIFKEEREKQKKQEELEKPPEKRPGDYTTTEDIRAFLEPLKKELESDRLHSESGYEVAKTKALIAGMREDSEKVRKLTNDFLQAQIGLLQLYNAKIDAKMKEMIEDAQEMEKNGTKGQVDKVKQGEAYRELEMEKNRVQMEIAQNQLQMHQTDLSAISSITTKLERAKRMAQAEGNIRRSNLLLGGAKEDSMAVKVADRQTMLTINNQIGQAIVELQKQLNSGKFQGEDRNDILLQIKELQAESRDNLVKIREKMTNSLSTYNLPSGIQGMTFQEAMQRKNDYRSYAITQGGLTINVNVPVQGNFGDEKVAKQRGQATARQVAQEVSNILSRQVKSFGAGVGYFSPFAVGRT